ncbi:PI-PLC X domain-containing protein 2,PI-PLC X domain-containing protein 3 [Mytilus coruscus]|uniref:PI-PLC X domain-containing protein 2,PI-PLC X domain-containing protein 3 n=1 Tax=Mytilus coruscus TaxID=42192 RepID=A0A6J8EGL2_MYTCO|nr:PI-PLC X domain-containing protein 2,PI-PLC X domain-containing protein 3 [Mytilus coruscus]
MAECKDFINWMSRLPEHLHTVPLNQLAIPGSHNSYSYDLDTNSEIGPDKADIRPFISMFGDMGKSVMKEWSVTQYLTFRQQLEHGVRYFDLRVASRKDKEGIFFLHSLYGMPVASGLDEIKSFLDEHPKEIILLDFNHLFDMTSNHHEKLLYLILRTFESKMCPHLDMDSVNLSMMWEQGLQVIVFYHNDVIKGNMMFWPNTSIKAPWANTTNVHDLITFLESNYKASKTTDMFNVTQGVLTPGAGTIMAHLNSSLHNVLAEKVAPRVVMWLKEKQTGVHGINVCMIDFVEKANFIPNVLKLNK